MIDQLQTHLGDKVVETVIAADDDGYPLMIGLTFTNEAIRVECVIRGNMADIEVLNLLVNAYDGLNNRLLLPDTTGLPLKRISKEDWSIGQTHLIPVAPDSKEFSDVKIDFTSSGSSVTLVSIHRVENTLWLITYINEKQRVDTRLEYHESEKLLFHGCPYASAEKILQEGFDHRRIGQHGQ